MAKRSRLSIAKPWIEKYFNINKKRIYSLKDLQKILNDHSSAWRLARTTTTFKFIDYLCKRSNLQNISLEFPAIGKVPRYLWGQEEENESLELIFELCLSLKPNSYLSHYTAMFIHDLTEQIPKNIFVTYEQNFKDNTERVLQQENIDKAFKKPVKESTNVTSFREYNITLLNGGFTDQTGVIKTNNELGQVLRLTNLERTLIDIAVRPNYSGGVYEVVKAYGNALPRISVNKINAYLKKINYTYPYHQVIGFYLEKAGCEEKRLKLLENNERQFDFYLTHNMDDVLYSKRWNLYYLKSLEIDLKELL